MSIPPTIPPMVSSSSASLRGLRPAHVSPHVDLRAPHGMPARGLLAARQCFQPCSHRAYVAASGAAFAGGFPWYPDQAASEIFAFYNDRGECENRIEEFKNGFRADRLSCHRFLANAFRLLLHGLAYNLVNWFRLELPQPWRSARSKPYAPGCSKSALASARPPVASVSIWLAAGPSRTCALSHSPHQQ